MIPYPWNGLKWIETEMMACGKQTGSGQFFQLLLYFVHC